MSLSAPKLLAVWVPIYTSMEAQTCPQTYFSICQDRREDSIAVFFLHHHIRRSTVTNKIPITMADEDEQPKTVYEFKDGEQETSEWCSRAGL